MNSLTFTFTIIDPEDWKCKWREMRAYYIRSSEKTRNAVKRNPIFDELKFLRPYIDAVKSGQPMSSKTARNSETDNAQARVNIKVAEWQKTIVFD